MLHAAAQQFIDFGLRALLHLAHGDGARAVGIFGLAQQAGAHAQGRHATLARDVVAHLGLQGRGNLHHVFGQSAQPGGLAQQAAGHQVGGFAGIATAFGKKLGSEVARSHRPGQRGCHAAGKTGVKHGDEFVRLVAQALGDGGNFLVRDDLEVMREQALHAGAALRILPARAVPRVVQKGARTVAGALG